MYLDALEEFDVLKPRECEFAGNYASAAALNLIRKLYGGDTMQAAFDTAGRLTFVALLVLPLAQLPNFDDAVVTNIAALSCR